LSEIGGVRKRIGKTMRVIERVLGNPEKYKQSMTNASFDYPIN